MLMGGVGGLQNKLFFIINNKYKLGQQILATKDNFLSMCQLLMLVITIVNNTTSL